MFTVIEEFFHLVVVVGGVFTSVKQLRKCASSTVI